MPKAVVDADRGHYLATEAVRLLPNLPLHGSYRILGGAFCHVKDETSTNLARQIREIGKRDKSDKSSSKEI